MSAEGPNKLDTSLPLIFVEDLNEPELDGEDKHHIENVLRVKYGDSINISDTKGRWRKCSYGPKLELVGEICLKENSQTLKTGVGFSPLKGGRTDFVVAKLTELGVDFMTPFFAGRSVVRPEPSKIISQMQRWKKIAREASMQCKRLYLPEIKEPVNYMDLVLEIKKGQQAEKSGEPLAKAARCDIGPANSNDLEDMEFSHLLVGPEGGWTEAEREALSSQICFSENVLRSDTAAIAAGVHLAQLKLACLLSSGSGKI